MKIIEKIPPAVALVFFLYPVVAVLTFLMPGGEYQTMVVQGREVINPDSFEFIEKSPQGLFAVLIAPIKGFVRSANIIGFVFIVGGAFAIFSATGAADAGLGKAIELSAKRPSLRRATVPALTLLFSIAGASFGMSEEVLVFALLTVPAFIGLGYDAILGAAVPFLGAGVGFAGAPINPFTVGVAQGIAELPIFGGWEYRLIVWGVLTAVLILFLMRYAAKIEKNPEKSPMHGIETEYNKNSTEKTPELSGRRIAVLIALSATFAVLLYGVNAYGWYIEEISGLFLAFGILAAALGGVSVSDSAKAFLSGARDMIPAAMVIGFAKGLLVILEDGNTIDSILFYASNLVGESSAVVSAEAMLVFQSAVNFFIPSGSGQAALTMPILAPLSDALGVGRQTAVLAFQLGDGLSNFVIPTSGVTMGVLSIAGIPYDRWVKWIFPLMIVLFAIAAAAMIPPVLFFAWN